MGGTWGSGLGKRRWSHKDAEELEKPRTTWQEKRMLSEGRDEA